MSQLVLWDWVTSLACLRQGASPDCTIENRFQLDATAAAQTTGVHNSSLHTAKQFGIVWGIMDAEPNGFVLTLCWQDDITGPWRRMMSQFWNGRRRAPLWTLLKNCDVGENGGINVLYIRSKHPVALTEEWNTICRLWQSMRKRITTLIKLMEGKSSLLMC